MVTITLNSIREYYIQLYHQTYHFEKLVSIFCCYSFLKSQKSHELFGLSGLSLDSLSRDPEIESSHDENYFYHTIRFYIRVDEL